MNSTYITHKRDPFFQIAFETISDGNRVLDIGPGDGDFARYCKNDEMYMLEGNSINVDKLKVYFPNVTLGRLPKLPFKDSFFDVIHMSHVIEHLQVQEVYDSLVEMDRCCKKGGCIVISAPLLWDGFYNDLSHVRPYPPAIFKRYLCNTNDKNFSRKKISSNYEMEHLEYRLCLEKKSYLKQNISLFLKLLYKVKENTLDRIFKVYKKTGYTVVLRKK